MQEKPHTKHKASIKHHDKKTVNVKIYQNTKIDTQRHITDKNCRTFE